MNEVKYKEVSFGDAEYDKLYLKHRWDNFDKPDYALKRADLLEKALNLSQSDRILDAGCGIGTYSIEFAKRGYTVVGMDISQTFLREAEQASRKARLDIEFIKGDYNKISFVEEYSVIFIIAAFFYESKRGLLSVLGKLHRALKPGGRLLLEHPNPPIRACRYPIINWNDEGSNVFTLSKTEYSSESQRVTFLWLKLDMNAGQICRSVGRHKLLNVSEFKDCAQKAGFRIQNLFKKKRLVTFDPKIDDGFFIVAEKK